MPYDMNKVDHIVELLKRRLTERGLSSSEERQLQTYLDEYPFISDLLEEMDDAGKWESTIREVAPFYLEDGKAQTDRVWERIRRHARTEESQLIIKRPKRYWKYAAAATVLMASLFSLYMFVWRDRAGQPAEEWSHTAQMVPGTNRATLVVSGEKEMVLNQLQEGIVMGQDVSYADGTLLLKGDAFSDPDKMFTLLTPKGGQYQIVLPDGSKVWLNAESSIEYPAQFGAQERKVSLNGEAYFEIARNPGKRFVVETFQERVEVLGTHFNINAYRSDGKSAVTLTEGSVEVSLVSIPARAQRLVPGQQSIVRDDHMEIHNVDIDESISWKNGEFMFNNETLEEVVKTLSRWYDFDVYIDPELAGLSVWGSISRYDDFDKVLNIIKMTDESINVSIQGRRVAIMK